MISHKLLLRIFGILGIPLPIFIILLFMCPSFVQVSASNQISPGSVTVGNFSLVYDFSDFANCTPDCVSITIFYNSANNELTYIDHRLPTDPINVTYLHDEQEKVLAEAVPHLRYYNFTDNTCKLHQPYCIASKLQVTSDLNIGSGPHTTISEWSWLSTEMINNANKIADILNNASSTFSSIANNQTKEPPMDDQLDPPG